MKIQASINGYAGEAATVYSLWKDGLLVVSKVGKFRADRFEDCYLISNEDLPSRDSFFADEYIPDAVAAYMRMASTKTIDILDSAAAANPTTSIDQADSSDGRLRFQVKPGIECARIAVLATCWHVQRANLISRTVDAAESFASLMRNGVITI